MSGSIVNTWDAQRGIDLITENARMVLLEAAEMCLYRYLTYAPVDTGYMISTASVQPGIDDNHIEVHVEAPYSVYVEFGHYSTAGNWVAPNPALAMAVGDTVTAFPQIDATISRR